MQLQRVATRWSCQARRVVGPGLALRPLGPDLLNVPVEVDGGGFLLGDSKGLDVRGDVRDVGKLVVFLNKDAAL